MSGNDEIAGSGGALSKSHGNSAEDSHHDGDEIHIPHVPLTGTQKLICVVELILSGLLTIFILSAMFRHIIDLPGRL